MKKLLSFAFAIVLLFSFTASAGGLSKSYDGTIALGILQEKQTLRKCTTPQKNVSFTSDDFEETAGIPAEYITIGNVEKSPVGVLKYAGIDVYESQSIPKRNLGLLKFVPGKNALGDYNFTFCADGHEEFSCCVSVLSEVNLAPNAENAEHISVSGIALAESFGVTEPEGDSYTVELLTYPKGSIKVSGTGFTYLSREGFSGEDSFTFRALDRYGNASSVASVIINVKENTKNIRFSDLDGHWCATDAVRLAEMGLMTPNEAGKFNPEEKISRGDFLAMSMIVAGLEEKVSLGEVSAFADDMSIPANIKSYAAEAQASGIISGYAGEGGKVYFNSAETVSRAQAASILSKIIGEDTASVMAPPDTPDWAKASVSTLLNAKIMRGNADGSLALDASLTKAQAASLLCNTMDYLEEKAQEEKEPSLWDKIIGFFK